MSYTQLSPKEERREKWCKVHSADAHFWHECSRVPTDLNTVDRHCTKFQRICCTPVRSRDHASNEGLVCKNIFYFSTRVKPFDFGNNRGDSFLRRSLNSRVSALKLCTRKTAPPTNAKRGSWLLRSSHALFPLGFAELWCMHHNRIISPSRMQQQNE